MTQSVADRLVAALDRLQATAANVDDAHAAVAGRLSAPTAPQAPFSALYAEDGPDRQADVVPRQRSALRKPNNTSVLAPKSGPTALPGYAAPTARAASAQEDGRSRAVHQCLDQASRPPPWVVADWQHRVMMMPPRSPRDAADGQALSPRAAGNQRRGAGVSMGLRAQAQRQLEQERVAVESRLQHLEEACAAFNDTFLPSAAPPGAAAAPSSAVPQAATSASTPGRQPPPQYGKSPAAAAAKTAVLDAAGSSTVPATVQRPQQQYYQHNLPVEPVAARQHEPPSAAATPAVLTPMTVARPRPHKQLGASTGPAGGTPAVVAPSAAAAGGAQTAPTATARRHLDFNAAGTDGAPPAAVDGATKAVGTAPLLSTAAPAAAVAAAGGDGARRPQRTVVEAAALAARPEHLAVLDFSSALPYSAPPQQPSDASRSSAWNDPLGLLAPESLHKFAGTHARTGALRAGRGPITQALWVAMAPVFEYDRARISHRERLHAGMADLEAGLHASYRQLVSSGALK